MNIIQLATEIRNLSNQQAEEQYQQLRNQNRAIRKSLLAVRTGRLRFCQIGKDRFRGPFLAHEKRNISERQ